jgi:serpin B
MMFSISRYWVAIIFPVFLIAQTKTDILQGSDEHGLKKQYVASVNEFGFNLLTKLVSKNPKQNVFISPTSLLYALAMANNGAEGDTKEAIQSVLHLQNFTRDEINTCSAQLSKSLIPTDTCAELNIANSLWLNQQFRLKDEFKAECEHNYSSSSFVRDFASRSTVNEINKWVADKTKGKITSIIDKLTSGDLLVLLNAIYFYGKWSTPFDRKSTAEKPFHLLDGTEKQYPRMSQLRVFEYHENPEYQVVSIPYGKQFSICIFLPRENDGLPQLLEELKEATWIQQLSQLKEQYGRIELPRFKIDYSIHLNEALISLGMGIAFNSDANFSRMTDSPAFISNVFHKTYIEVNEQGTKAAASTSIHMTYTTSAYYEPPTIKFNMIIDHPFFCAIKENTTGLIIFAGSIFDPKSDPYVADTNDIVTPAINSQQYERNLPVGKVVVDSIYLIGSNILQKDVLPVDGIDSLQNRIHYPILARRAGLEGNVIIEFKIDKRGMVAYSKIVYSDGPIFNDPCVEGLQKTSFAFKQKSNAPDKTILLSVKFILIRNH